MARKCFGTRSRNGVETPKPVATSTAAAQPLISQQLATPRTAFRSKPRCLDSPISRKPTFRHNSQHRELRFALNRDTASPRTETNAAAQALISQQALRHCHRRFAASRDAANSQRRGKHSPSDSTRQFAGSNALFGRSGMNFHLCSACSEPYLYESLPFRAIIPSKPSFTAFRHTPAFPHRVSLAFAQNWSFPLRVFSAFARCASFPFREI